MSLPRLPRRSAHGIALALASALGIACTVVLNDDPVQCSADSDCTGRGPDFVNTTCSPQGICVDAAASVDASVAECKKTSDCEAKGNQLLCNTEVGQCVSYASEPDCTVAYGDPSEDGAVVFGLLSDVGHDDTFYFRQAQHLTGARLAFSEVFDKAGARFPGGGRGVLVACSQHRPKRVSAFLANIGAKAVIGPSTEDRQKAVVETLSQARVPSFSPWINGSPASVVPDAASFAWLVGFRRPDVVLPLNALVAEQEAKVKAESLGAIKNVRVAVLINKPTTTTYNAFAEYGDLMDQRLIFNGKSAVENERDVACNGCYKRFSTSQASAEIVQQRAEEILAFNPHFIIPFTDIDWGAQLLPKLEELYAAAPQSTFRPIYLQPFLQIEDAGYQALPVTDPAVRKRITGIVPLRDNSFEVFQNKFREAYRPPSAPDKLGPTPNPGAGRAFETSLLVLFAHYAAMVQNPNATAEDLISAIPVVTDAASTSKITLNDIQFGIARLNAKEKINLEGLFTSFGFDLTTNSAPPLWTTWCVSAAAQYVSGSRVFANGSFGAPAYCE